MLSSQSCSAARTAHYHMAGRRIARYRTASRCCSILARPSTATRADITRTFMVGEPDREMATIYDTVRAANEAGIRAARPGVQAQEIDRAARKVISDAGYGDFFIHRTGHGLGLDGHEEPYMREGNTQMLEPS